ncbi:NAD(P)-binding protein [Thomasclavelia sp.]|uniref:protoporphyrinogen/coproporphyrinogen oxidase n=1 Tax=Thomasclavelia sp. TaxID=3025757 RepID=UPI0025DE8E2C|nr:NAD(P)-binding protein [Thomasclavelia sp.]
MISIDYLILGAGISGLAAGQKLKENGKNFLILEKNDSYGGLCDNFQINGFRFDRFVHFSFTNNRDVRKFFDQVEYYAHQPIAYNYYNGYWIKHPAQNNLLPISKEEKQLVLDGIKNRQKYKNSYQNDYEKWLRFQFGDYFAENFPMKYTRKYWGVEARELETKWVGNRVYQPTFDEILEGMNTQETPITYYAKEMRYPKSGGFKAFLSGFVYENCIKYNQEVIKIDAKNKLVYTMDETYSYNYLISSIPLPEYKKLMEIDCNVKNLIDKLYWTSAYIVSLGFKNSLNRNDLWQYIYNEDILPARIYSPSLKSPDNCPEGCSSIQAEIYFKNTKAPNQSKEWILDNTLNQLNKAKIINLDDLIIKDIRFEKYANIIFDHNIYSCRDKIRNYLSKENIITIGRFGEWKYFWSDQSFLSGYNFNSNL